MISEVDIYNQSLAMIGQEPIRSLSESNRRAGMGKAMYPAARDYLLTKYFWGFAITIEALAQLDEEHPEGYVYAYPLNCLAPKALVPKGDPPYRWWRQKDRIIVPDLDASQLPRPIYLKFVERETQPSHFSQEFIEVLAVDIASRICMPLTQDAKLTALLVQDARTLKMECAADEANNDENYQPATGEGDTFINVE